MHIMGLSKVRLEEGLKVLIYVKPLKQGQAHMKTVPAFVISVAIGF